MAIRYRLRADISVLQRPDAALQIGLDVADQAVIPAAPRGADALLRSLRGGATLADLERNRGAIPRAWVRTTVTSLTEAGLVHTQAAPQPNFAIVGSGVLADAVAHAAGRIVPRSEIWSPGRHPGRLVVLCCDTVEADRVPLRWLALSGQPHLIVRVEPERAIVGPFVLPGSPCVTCTDLVRRDLDAGWPHMLVQLCRTRYTPSAAQAAWAAGTALAQVSAWASGSTPDAVGATIEVTASDGALGHRRWPVRPDCAVHLSSEELAA